MTGPLNPPASPQEITVRRQPTGHPGSRQARREVRSPTTAAHLTDGRPAPSRQRTRRAPGLLDPPLPGWERRPARSRRFCRVRPVRTRCPETRRVPGRSLRSSPTTPQVRPSNHWVRSRHRGIPFLDSTPPAPLFLISPSSTSPGAVQVQDRPRASELCLDRTAHHTPTLVVRVRTDLRIRSPLRIKAAAAGLRKRCSPLWSCFWWRSAVG